MPDLTLEIQAKNAKLKMILCNIHNLVRCFLYNIVFAVEKTVFLKKLLTRREKSSIIVKLSKRGGSHMKPSRKIFEEI